MARLSRSEQATLIHAWRLKQTGPDQWQGPCPAKDHSSNRTGAPLSLKAGQDDALINCFAGCQWQDIKAAIDSVLGSRRNGTQAQERGPGKEQAQTQNRPEPISSGENKDSNMSRKKIQRARDLWNEARDLTEQAALPARLWLQNHGLPLDLAYTLRWHERLHGLIAPLAPGTAWQKGQAYITVMAVSVISIDPEGRPRADRGGVTKRTYGIAKGHFTIIDPRKLAQTRVICVTEGIKDGLAIGKKTGCPVIITHGTSGLKILAWERIEQDLLILADHDTPGIKAGNEAAARHKQNGGKALVLKPKTKGYDPYDALANRLDA